MQFVFHGWCHWCMNLPTCTFSLNIAKSCFAESLNTIEANVFFMCVLGMKGWRNKVTNCRIGPQGVLFLFPNIAKILRLFPWNLFLFLNSRDTNSPKQSILIATPWNRFSFLMYNKRYNLKSALFWGGWTRWFPGEHTNLNHSMIPWFLYTKISTSAI